MKKSVTKDGNTIDMLMYAMVKEVPLSALKMPWAGPYRRACPGDRNVSTEKDSGPMVYSPSPLTGAPQREPGALFQESGIR